MTTRKLTSLTLPAMLLFAALYFVADGLADGTTGSHSHDSSDLAKLVDWMTGHFSSAEQAESDSAYFHIVLHMVPIWRERSDAHWLYVEQAVADYTDEPYRQRVYRVSQTDSNTFESRVYTIEEPIRFAGAWKKDDPLRAMTPDSLRLRDGCAIYLHMEGDSAFVGSTVDRDCESNLRDAAYATSEVRITDRFLLSWDRGYDSDGNQVWGAEKGGYVFKKKLSPDQSDAEIE